jgi:hypothetical protein
MSDVSETNNNSLPSFVIGGNCIDYVVKWTHLGHILNAELSDIDDVEHRRTQTVKQINDVLCYFGKLDTVIKLKLLYSYCSSIYGSVLWDLESSTLSSFCVSWRRGLKHVWKLPINTHSDILFGLCGKRPIEVELRYRTLSFLFRCINSENTIVRSVTRNLLTSISSPSPLAKNYVVCCKFFGTNVMVPEFEKNFDYVPFLQDVGKWYNFVRVSASKIAFLFELISIRDGNWFLSNMASSVTFHINDIKQLIYYICTN